MKKYLTLLPLVLLSIILSCQSVFALTQEEADVYNNLYYPQSVYNGGINAAPQATSQDGYVNIATGSTNIKVTDLTLPGVNGFDLNITRTYNSTNASLFEAYLKQTKNYYDVSYYMIKGSKRVYRRYTSLNETTINYYNICLTPNFGVYLHEKDAEWMVKNQSEYEYNYASSPMEFQLFTSRSEAQAVVDYINSTMCEIDAYFPYLDTIDCEINYYDFEVVDICKTYTYIDYTNVLLDDTATERYSKLGAGWEFDFPYVETRYGYEDTYEYLHFVDKGVWLIDFSDGGDNNLSGYPLNDIKLIRDTSVSHDGMQSKYRVDEKDGTKHYFGADGRLLIQQDRHGNQIKFYCDTESYMNVWGKYKDYPYIKKIVDTLGREVVFTFNYDEDDNITMYMTITNPADSTDVKQYRYDLDKLSNSEIGITGYSETADLMCDEWVLKQVTDPSSNYYSYSYDFLQTKFNFLDRNDTFNSGYYYSRNESKGNSRINGNNFEEFSGIHNTYALLTSASKTGGKSYYFNYAPFIKNCTPEGSMMFYKVYRSYEERADSYSDPSSHLNSKTYNYDINVVGEYDGYSTHHGDYGIDNSYEYAVKVTDANLLTDKISYKIYDYTYLGTKWESTILLEKLTEQGTDHKSTTEYLYDQTSKLMTAMTVKNYSVLNNSNYITTSKTYTYDTDSYGDMLTETPNNISDRTVTYTYDSTYHFPLTKVYKQDANTTIREEYVPTSDGKKIEYVNIYVNNVLKSKIRYAHDIYGNIINQKAYSDNSNYIETEYTYQDGAYIINEEIKQVKDNNNVASDISVSLTYDYWGYPITQTDANGNITAYEYDKIGRITQITNPDATNKTYEYFTGVVSEYDELGNCITNYYTDSGESEYVEYDEFGVDYNHRYFTPFGQLETEVIYSDTLDTEGNQTEQNRTQYTYDTYQRPLTKEVYDSNDTLIYKETYSYEVTADYIKETTTVVGDANNPSIVTSVYYDNYGNKIKTENGDDYETYTYDYAGNVTSVKSARANAEGWAQTRQIEYDFMGNVIKETDELGNSTRAEYDQLGRLIKAFDKANYATEYKYDNLGRVIEVKTPFEEKSGTVYYSTKQMWYDNNGNVVKERVSSNAAGETPTWNEVTYTYDNRNRLIMTKSYDGTKYNYVQNYYDATGNLLRVYTGLHSPLTINGLDNVVTNGDTEYAVTKYSYDALGRLLTTTDALGNVESNTYDTSNGLLLSSTDKNGNTFNFTYDGLGKLTSKKLSDGTNAETTVYGLTGQPLSKQNSTATISYTYNDKGLVASETNSASGVTKTFTYDSAGNVSTMTVTRNGTVDMSLSYVYDKLNRLISVSENGNVIATYSYDVKGNRIKTVVPGGELTTYGYNLANLMTSLTTGYRIGESYTYYLNGNQKWRIANNTETSYTYDSMNRLIKENDTEYTFDDFGNRITMSDGEVTTTYSYDLNNRLTESIEENGDITTNTKFFYDNNGNQISKAIMINQPYTEGMSGNYTASKSTNSYIALYDYNCYNQLIGVDTNGVVSSYAYAPDGLRHSKTVGSNTTTFVYDNANIIEEITADGINKYYRGIEIIKNDDGVYYCYNEHGDVSWLMNSSGQLIEMYKFDAYGNRLRDNTTYNPFGYRGEYQDEESGLIYLRARMYDPTTGRFINEDPIRAGANWYIYCGNNPVVFVDPWGLIGIKPDGSIYMDQADTEIDRQLLQLKIEYKNSNSSYERERIAGKAQKLRNENAGKYTVMAEHSLEDYYIPDLTSQINSIMENNEASFIEHSGNYFWFKNHVKTGALVDVKNSNAAVFSRPKYSYHIIYNGEVMRADASGNILYGYLGTAASFDEFTLLAFAGLYQIHEDKKSLFTFFDGNYGDNPGDGEQIIYGIALYYERKNPGYVYPMPMSGPSPTR